MQMVYTDAIKPTLFATDFPLFPIQSPTSSFPHLLEAHLLTPVLPI